MLGAGAFAAAALSLFSCGNKGPQPQMSLSDAVFDLGSDYSHLRVDAAPDTRQSRPDVRIRPDAKYDAHDIGLDVIPEMVYDAGSDLYIPADVFEAKVEIDAKGDIKVEKDSLEEVLYPDTSYTKDTQAEAETYIVTSPYYTSDDPFLGNIDAPVTIVEFGGYQCPYTKKFHDEVLPLLMAEYIETGLVKYVFRDFPFEFHEFSFESANAAECAKEQGKFWPYHHLLFSNQPATPFTVLLIAEQLGFNMETFTQCHTTGKYSAKVQGDFQEGIALGINGTPSFFVNDVLLQGAYPYNLLKQEIDKQLGL
jgi:protein-disulfide isomerase